MSNYRRLSDARPSLLAVVRRAQTHKGWNDDQALDWLNRHAGSWSTSLGNAGSWIVGAIPNHGGPGIDATVDQIFTNKDARLVAQWRARPWLAMTIEAWQRWQVETWDFPEGTTFYAMPEISEAIAALDVSWPLEWWPHGVHETENITGTDIDAERMEREVKGHDTEPYITALALLPDGTLRLLRQRFADWYEGTYTQGEQPEPVGQMQLL